MRLCIKLPGERMHARFYPRCRKKCKWEGERWLEIRSVITCLRSSLTREETELEKQRSSINLFIEISLLFLLEKNSNNSHFKKRFIFRGCMLVSLFFGDFKSDLERDRERKEQNGCRRRKILLLLFLSY